MKYETNKCSTGGGFKEKILPVILLVVLLTIVGGITYAAFTSTAVSNANSITSGLVSMSYAETSSVITINNALPMSDDNGKVQTTYFDFSVTSNLTLNSGDPSEDISYDIILEPLSVDSGYTALTASQIKVYLENKGTSSVLVAPTLINSLTSSGSNKILLSTSHTHSYGTNTVTTNYRLRAWIDINVDASSWTSSTKNEYKFRININGEANSLERPNYAYTTIKDNNTIKTLSSSYGTETIGTSTDKSGLYAFTEDGVTDYFFRGYVNNNWAMFGQDSSGNDIYWRIYRITSSNEIRMIYAGIVAPTASTQYVDTTNTTNIGTSAFNTSYQSAEYVGYKYTMGIAHGTDTNSTMKTYIDNWYTANLTQEDSFISTSSYCYDRTPNIGTVAGTAYSGTGVGTTHTMFMATKRLISESSDVAGGTGASLVCSNSADKYALKIGLISVDEANIAGLKYAIYSASCSSCDENNYLISKLEYWTGTPYGIYGKNNIAFVFGVSSGGRLSNQFGVYDSTFGVRPVISLVSTVKVSEGNGTYGSPYEFSLS